MMHRCLAISILFIFCLGCTRPRQKASRVPDLIVETKGITMLYQDGLSLKFTKGSDEISASYKFSGGPFQEAAPESARVNFTPEKVSASALLRALGASGFCKVSHGRHVADCGDEPLGVVRDGSEKEIPLLYLKPTECEPSYYEICRDSGLTSLLELVRSEIPRAK